MVRALGKRFWDRAGCLGVERKQLFVIDFPWKHWFLMVFCRFPPQFSPKSEKLIFVDENFSTKKNSRKKIIVFSNTNMFQVVPENVSGPNSTLRGNLQGFSAKTLDFRWFLSKVYLYSAGLRLWNASINLKSLNSILLTCKER